MRYLLLFRIYTFYKEYNHYIFKILEINKNEIDKMDADLYNNVERWCFYA